MPRVIAQVRVLAIDDGTRPTFYITDNFGKYDSAAGFMACRLVEPHRERFEIRSLNAASWDRESPEWSDVPEEVFRTYFEYMCDFDPYRLYSVDEMRRAFDTLWERGGSLWW